jgi:hypothetical protein
MTTNGQILTDRNIQKLVGRPIELYISLDAATPLTYSRLRNSMFEKILGNIRRLVAAKGGPGHFPHVFLVFMPMKCNLHELDDFLRLCKSLNVDRAILRPLNYSPASELNAEREGYTYEYQKELLPFREVLHASARAKTLAKELGLTLSDQMNFGGSLEEIFPDEFKGDAGAPDPAPVPAEDPSGAAADSPQLVPAASLTAPEPPIAATTPVVAAAPAISLGGERLPACQEPWKSLYILRRGVMPCCYGGAPIAPMASYRESWNSPVMQGIRHELLNGRFHDYCLRSPACPIVRKAEHSSSLPLKQRALLVSRDYFARVNRRLNGVPVAVWITARRSVAKMLIHARLHPRHRHRP